MPRPDGLVRLHRHRETIHDGIIILHYETLPSKIFPMITLLEEYVNIVFG